VITLSAINARVLKALPYHDKQILLAVLQRKVQVIEEIAELDRQFNTILFPVADIGTPKH
jgi:hypothetical protein